MNDYDELPRFRKVRYEVAHKFAANALSHGGKTTLRQLRTYGDNHFRALFSSNYFEDNSEGGKMNEGPTKSQWSTLKKRFKRLEHDVFLFKETGREGDLYYIDFGFFID